MSDADWAEGSADGGWNDSVGGGASGSADMNDGWGSGENEFDVDDDGMSDANVDDVGGVDVQIANIFYEAEDLVRSQPQQALQKFQQLLTIIQTDQPADIQNVLSKLSADTRQSFIQSMVHIVLLYYKLQQASAMVNQYRTLLSYVPNMSQAESTDSINTVLNNVAAGTQHTDMSLLREMYTMTSSTLAAVPDTQRTVFGIDMKLCKLYVDTEQYQQADTLLHKLHQSCMITLPTGELVDDRADKGNELLEIYALKIRLSFAQNNVSEMRSLYEATKDLNAAVKDPRSQSVIRECWGLMHAHDKQWQRAYAEFYTAFQAYQEISLRDKAKQCLQYVIVTNLLAGGTQNPFDAREAKVYQNDADIQSIVQLRAAYEKVDVSAFNTALQEIQQAADPFITHNLNTLILDFHSRAVCSLIHSYQRIAVQSLAHHLNVSSKQVEQIVVQLIVDGEISGLIDQLNGTVKLSRVDKAAWHQYTAQQQWTKQAAKIAYDASHAQLPSY